MSQQAKINVLLVEDRRLMFEGLTSLLGEYPDMNVAGVATSVADAVEKALLLKPDLVLIDYRLPDGDGAQASERIRAKLPFGRDGSLKLVARAWAVKGRVPT